MAKFKSQFNNFAESLRIRMISEEKEWINDAEHKCSTCEAEFKVYCVDEIPTVNFCPHCGSSQLDK